MALPCLLLRRRGSWRYASLLALSLALIGLTSCSKTNQTSNPTAPSPVGSVSMDQPSATIEVGDTGQLTATPEDARTNQPLSGRDVTWSSDHPEVVTVDSNGAMTAVAAGTATITATCDGICTSSRITVSAVPVATITVTPASASITMGGRVHLTATLKDANNNTLTGRIVRWSSVDPTVARVNRHGHVVGVAAGGPVTITAKSGNKSGTSAITVATATPPVPVASVTVTPASASIQAGGTVQLTATPRDAGNHPLTGRAVTWSSANTAVAAVNSHGLVTGVAAGGPVTITATCETKTGTSAITVTTTTPPVPVASVTVSPASASVTAGSTVQLTATPRDAGNHPLTGRAVVWSSASTAVATVNSHGLVTGMAAGGPVTITATCETKTSSSAVTVTARPPGGGGSAQFNHVFIVVEENTNYANVIGNSAMPYLNSLAQQYGLATNYYADAHPSIGNYLMMTCGQIITNNDSYAQTVSADNVVRELDAAGKTWKAYAEDLPSVGFVQLNYQNSYASRHNPVVYYTDVHDNAAQSAHVVPFTQFATDLASYNFPNYCFIAPNMCNDMHDCGPAVADAWLRTHIDPLVRNPQFQLDGLLIIVYDESGSDNTHGGGRVVWVAVSGKSKRGYQSTTLYQHESTLRLSLKALGVNVFPGAAATAPDMGEFFNPATAARPAQVAQHR